jgi:hypothetical protein
MAVSIRPDGRAEMPSRARELSVSSLRSATRPRRRRAFLLCNGADFVKGSEFAPHGASSHITLIRRSRIGLPTVSSPRRPAGPKAPYGASRYRSLLRLPRLLGAMPALRTGRLRRLRGRTLMNVLIAKAGLKWV